MFSFVYSKLPPFTLGNFMKFEVHKEPGANEVIKQIRMHQKDWESLQILEQKTDTKWQSIVRQMITHCLKEAQ